MNDIRNCFKNCKYVDDTVILSVHTDLRIANKNLQNEFWRFQLWAHDEQLQKKICI